MAIDWQEPGKPSHGRRTLTLRFHDEHTHHDPKTAKKHPSFRDMDMLKPRDVLRALGFPQPHPTGARLALAAIGPEALV